MNSWMLWGAGLVVLVVIGVVALSTAKNPVAVYQEGAVAVSSSTIQDENAQYAIKVEYPKFGIAVIDARIQQRVMDAVNEFKALPPNPPESATPQNSFEGSYDSVYIGPDILSAKLVLSEYTGGAHPMTILSGINFDRETGRELMLQDALGLIGMSTAEVSAEATKQFVAKFNTAFFKEGADTNPENYSSFVISKDSVTFIFQAYQVAAYAAGPQEISFPRVK